jgi:hypothetical protein
VSLDEFNVARHVGDDSPSADAPPTPERVAAFFDFLKTRIASSRKYAPAARDYALFRVLYHAGLRSEEVVMLDRSDVHFGRGPFGKLHVRFGKGAKGSGPRPRWVPMLDGAGSGVALVPRRGAWPVPGRPSAVVRRVRREDGCGHDPQPVAALDECGRTTGRRVVQPARDAASSEPAAGEARQHRAPCVPAHAPTGSATRHSRTQAHRPAADGRPQSRRYLP